MPLNPEPILSRAEPVVPARGHQHVPADTAAQPEHDTEPVFLHGNLGCFIHAGITSPIDIAIGSALDGDGCYPVTLTFGRSVHRFAYDPATRQLYI